MNTHRALLTTERLTLRKPIEADFDAFAAAAADEEVMRFLGSPPMSRPAAWRAFAGILGHWELRGFGFFSVLERESGLWVGRVGPLNPEGWPAPEVGWTLGRASWGKGYAREAAAAAISWAFETLGWTRVTHCIDPKNIRSRRVAEAIGSRILESDVPLPLEDADPVDLWGQSAEEWRAAQKRT